MSLPANLRYTSDHEWVSGDGPRVRVGITDYAQDALGDIVFIQLPTVGTSVAQNASFSEIESTKSVNDVYAPIAGVVVAVNELLSDKPELVNTDPYGDGWICEIECDPADLASLLDAEAYQLLLGH